MARVHKDGVNFGVFDELSPYPHRAGMQSRCVGHISLSLILCSEPILTDGNYIQQEAVVMTICIA